LDYPILHEQSQLRRKIRAQRRALSPKEQQSNSYAMGRILTRSTLFRNSRKIALYLETDGEIAVSQLLPLIRCDKKRSFLPVLRPLLTNKLWFSKYTFGDKLIQNRYGIPEPDIRKQRPISPSSLDLVLVPLVAFDTNLNRIGMGGGFYDKTFSYLKTRNVWHKPKLIGVAHELQKVKSIQTNPWDIPLDGVVTESNFYI
jgi:5-formyltetrahydrofolate cyclo-ligase